MSNTINMQYFERYASVLTKFLAGHSPAEIVKLCELRQPRPMAIVLDTAKWIIRRAERGGVPNPFGRARHRHLFHLYPGNAEYRFNLHGLKTEDVLDQKEFFEERLVIELKLYREKEEAKKLLPPKPPVISRFGSVNIIRDVAIARRILEGATYVQAAQEFSMSVNAVNMVFMKRFRVGMLRVLRSKEEHPFTFEKYPYLYMTTNVGKTLNHYSVHKREILAEKEFVSKLLDAQDVETAE
jgi:hypothetical protein